MNTFTAYGLPAMLKAMIRAIARCGVVALLTAPCLEAAAIRAQPQQILLMRHGHKLALPSDHNLSPIGFQRAIALASLVPACFGMPTHIKTYSLDPLTGKNARSYQTAVPLAVASQIDIRIELDSMAESSKAGAMILTNQRYNGANLVMFWEHRHLPMLAQGLGWPSMPPIEDDDLIYQLNYSGLGVLSQQVGQ
jgi:hypothetical protein